MRLYYKDSNCVLTQGDCLEVMTKMAEKGLKFDAIITDPPYGTTACKWDTIIPFDKMWNCINNLRRDSASVVLFGSQPFTSELIHSNIQSFKYEIIWEKCKPSNFMLAKKQILKYHENILVFYDKQCIFNPQKFESKPMNTVYKSGGQKATGIIGVHMDDIDNTDINRTDRYPKSILKIDEVINNSIEKSKGNHPTQKPIKLMEYLIKTYTNEGSTILDFTCGSGTTLVAAKKLNRKCYGIELEEKYCEITKNRLIELDTP